MTLSLSMSMPSSRWQARVWAAKASLISTRSMSAMVRPALARAFRLAEMGPMPITSGSTPVVATDRMRHRGLQPAAWAAPADMTTTPEEASFMPEALPAVTLPPSLKEGFKMCIRDRRKRWPESQVLCDGACSSCQALLAINMETLKAIGDYERITANCPAVTWTMC